MIRTAKLVYPHSSNSSNREVIVKSVTLANNLAVFIISYCLAKAY